jgi:hypothetical protein
MINFVQGIPNSVKQPTQLSKIATNPIQQQSMSSNNQQLQKVPNV